MQLRPLEIGFLSSLGISALLCIAAPLAPLFLACQPEEIETVATGSTAPATTWASGTTTIAGTTGTATIEAIDPEVDTPSSGSTSEGGEDLESDASASVDSKICSDQAACSFTGCVWRAEIEFAADCSDCAEDPCITIECTDACQRPLQEALENCSATYPACAALTADPLAECLERCRKAHTVCIYEIICETPTGPDTTPCDPPEIKCKGACDPF